jgi:SAM-dependent methyltransferase
VSPSPRYHEAVWAAIPAGAEPAHAALRERFLLERLARERAGGFEARAPDAREGAGGSEGGAPADHERPGRPLRALDVGCGEGRFASALARAGAEVVALDASAEAVRRARERHPGLDFRVADCEAALPLPDASFDLVWAGETIEHVADTAACLSELRRVLRSGGVLLLSTPDHGPLTRLRTGLSRRAFERRFDPRSEHLRFYTRRALYDLLAAFRFAEVEVRGAGGVPGARALLLASGRRLRF